MSELLNYLWGFLGNNFEAILAICALVLTVNRISVMRKHNKISVKPFLTDHISKSLDDKNHYNYSFELINNGLGPAFIKSFSITFDNKVMSYKDDDDLKVKLQELLPHGTVQSARILGDGYALAAKERCELLNIYAVTRASDKMEAIKNTLNKLS